MAIDPAAVAAEASEDAEDFELDPTSEEFNKPQFESLVNGTYQLTVAEMPTIYHAGTGTDMLNLKWAIDSAPGQHTFDSVALTKKSSWRIAQFLLALGKGDKVSSATLKSEEYRRGLINAHVTADLGTLQTVGKNGGLMLVNHVTSYCHSENKPKPINPGTRSITQVSPKAKALIASMGGTAPAMGDVPGSSAQSLSPEEAAASLAF